MKDLKTTTPKEQPDYLSYLLRLWRVNDEEEAAWRASLESVDTRERTGFAGLEDLFDFLQERTGASPASSEDEGETGE